MQSYLCYKSFTVPPEKDLHEILSGACYEEHRTCHVIDILDENEGVN